MIFVKLNGAIGLRLINNIQNNKQNKRKQKIQRKKRKKTILYNLNKNCLKLQHNSFLSNYLLRKKLNNNFVLNNKRQIKSKNEEIGNQLLKNNHLKN